MVYQKFEALGRWVWDTIRLSEKLHIRQGEETITDTILLEIERQRYPNIRVIQTPKHLEVEKGTDWEWYVGANRYGWVRFAIQAKKLKVASGRYESLSDRAGTSPTADLQAKVLRDYADANAGVIPLYSFYNYFPSATQATHWHCPLTFEQRLLGWTVTPLRIVEHALVTHGGKSFDAIHRRTNTLPVRCLFCCPALIMQYLIPSSTGAVGSFLGEPFQKLARLPQEIVLAAERGSIETFSLDFYNPEIGIFPRRIMVVDVSELLPEGLGDPMR